jgi:hypothetical protein
MGEHPTPEHILQIGMGFWASKTLLSAVEMGLFTELAQHPEPLDAVQSSAATASTATRPLPNFS